MINTVWLGILFLLPIPPLMVFSIKFSNISLWWLSVASGISSYVWMLAAVFLSTRPKRIEQRIGLPDMYLIHGGVGFFALLSLHLHAFLLSSSDFTKQVGGLALYLFTFLFFYSMIFLGGVFSSKVPAVKKLKRKFENILRHEVSVWIHRLNVLVIVLVYLHMTSIKYIRGAVPFFLMLTGYTVFALGTYLFYLAREKKGRHIGRVKSVNSLGGRVTELTVRCDLNDSVFRSGDFVFLSFPDHPNLREPHPFSLGRVPKEGELVFMIDGVGDFTKELTRIKEGSKVCLSGGYGILHNILEGTPEGDKFVFIGGGVGAVPLMSLAEEFEDREILFLYTVQKDKQLLCEEMFQAWNERKNFRSVLQKGRFTQEQCEEYITIGKEYVYLIAGTADMNLFYRNWLIKRGVSSKKIYFEGFYF